MEAWDKRIGAIIVVFAVTIITIAVYAQTNIKAEPQPTEMPQPTPEEKSIKSIHITDFDSIVIIEVDQKPVHNDLDIMDHVICIVDEGYGNVYGAVAYPWGKKNWQLIERQNGLNVLYVWN